MAPAKPPFPAPLRRPSQPSLGIQISKLISESASGWIFPATRQNGGKPETGVVIAPLMVVTAPETGIFAGCIFALTISTLSRRSRASAAHRSTFAGWDGLVGVVCANASAFRATGEGAIQATPPTKVAPISKDLRVMDIPPFVLKRRFAGLRARKRGLRRV